MGSVKGDETSGGEPCTVGRERGEGGRGDGVGELGGEEQMRQLRVVRLRPRPQPFVRLPRSPVQREMPMGELNDRARSLCD